jgi:DNA-binding transcriptional ArsR family regulator
MPISNKTAQITPAGHDERLTDAQVAQAVLMLSMLAEPTRLRLLWALHDGELGVSALAEAAECTPTVASQHLGKLRMVGLVQQRADGRARLYRLSGGHVLRLLAEALAQADHTVSGIANHG